MALPRGLDALQFADDSVTLHTIVPFPLLGISSNIGSNSMSEERKYAILFAATILAAKKLHEIGDRPSPAREACISDAITKAELMLKKIYSRWPSNPDEA